MRTGSCPVATARPERAGPAWVLHDHRRARWRPTGSSWPCRRGRPPTCWPPTTPRRRPCCGGSTTPRWPSSPCLPATPASPTTGRHRPSGPPRHPGATCPSWGGNAAGHRLLVPVDQVAPPRPSRRGAAAGLGRAVRRRTAGGPRRRRAGGPGGGRAPPVSSTSKARPPGHWSPGGPTPSPSTGCTTCCGSPGSRRRSPGSRPWPWPAPPTGAWASRPAWPAGGRRPGRPPGLSDGPGGRTPGGGPRRTDPWRTDRADGPLADGPRLMPRRGQGGRPVVGRRRGPRPLAPPVGVVAAGFRRRRPPLLAAGRPAAAGRLLAGWLAGLGCFVPGCSGPAASTGTARWS